LEASLQTHLAYEYLLEVWRLLEPFLASEHDFPVEELAQQRRRLSA